MLNFISKYIFFTKVFNRLSFEKNHIWRILPIKKIVLSTLGNIPSKEIFCKRVEFLLGHYDIKLFEKLDSHTKDIIFNCADNTLSHTFELLGSGLIKMDIIDWHKDFKSGHTWPKKFYRDLRSYNIKGSEIKIPWELSRCHHLLWLGEAYLMTDDEKYAREVVDQIENWIEENPIMYSINWTCAMDVAIRSVNWMFAINMILTSKSLTDNFISKLYKSLYLHGFYIFNNLEKTIPYSANHYASNLVGLLYLGQLFKNTNNGKKWWKFSLNEFFYEVRTQILPSGVHFEKSTSYHRLMVELFSYPIYMMQRIGIEVPIDILYRIKSMYNFVADYIKPNNNAPLLGDNDDGRFLPFARYDFLNHGYLINNQSIDNAILSAGDRSLFNINKEISNKSVLCEDAGIAILKKEDAYVIFSNSGLSKYPTNNREVGTHTHNDLLSFELSIGGEDVLVDPGTYVYTSDIQKRNEFRSTMKHNTVVVDDEEQNILSAVNSFSILKNSVVESLKLNVCSNCDHCYGKYTTINEKMSHYRSLELTSGELMIHDRIIKNGSDHKAFLYLHFAEGLFPVIEKNGLTVESTKYVIRFEFNGININQIDLKNDSISTSYGIIKNTKSLAVGYSFKDHTTMVTTISWEIKSNFNDISIVL